MTDFLSSQAPDVISRLKELINGYGEDGKSWQTCVTDVLQQYANQNASLSKSRRAATLTPPQADDVNAVKDDATAMKDDMTPIDQIMVPTEEDDSPESVNRKKRSRDEVCEEDQNKGDADVGGVITVHRSQNSHVSKKSRKEFSSLATYG